MLLLRTVVRGDAAPHGVVRVHALTGGRARQQLEEDLEVVVARQDLLDADEGDERVGQGQAHAAVALGLDDDERAGVGEDEVGARDGDLGAQELLAQVQAGRVGQLGRVGRDVLGARTAVVLHLAQEDLADLGAIAVDARYDDVAGAVVAELDDELGQVGLPGRDALLLEVLVQVGLLGGDRLDLHDLLDALGLGDVADDAVGLVGVAGPVHLDAVRGEGLLGLLQVVVEVTADAVLHLVGGLADVLPVGGLGHAQGALVADGRRGVAHVLALDDELELLLDGLGELRLAQEGAAVLRGGSQAGDAVVALGDATQFSGHGTQSSSVLARTSTRWMVLTPAFCRERTPPMLSRQELSQPTTYSAPVSRM